MYINSDGIVCSNLQRKFYCLSWVRLIKHYNKVILYGTLITVHYTIHCTNQTPSFIIING